MEKVIYLAWRAAGSDVDAFCRELRGPLAARLKQLSHGLRINVSDTGVAKAVGLRQSVLKPPPDAFIQVWLDSAIARFRQPVDDAVASHTARCAAYLVTESQPIVNLKHPPRSGERTEGFAQIAILRRPPKLDYAAWLDAWHNHHTGVAVETQSTFEYLQNVVVRPLSLDAPAIDAIVEECFPAGAMTDYKVFFDAPGDDAKFKQNLQRMMQSVSRFIEHGTIDVVPTSQYQF